MKAKKYFDRELTTWIIVSVLWWGWVIGAMVYNIFIKQ